MCQTLHCGSGVYVVADILAFREYLPKRPIKKEVADSDWSNNLAVCYLFLKRNLLFPISFDVATAMPLPPPLLTAQ